MKNKKRLIYLEDAKEALTGWETDPTDEEIEYTLDNLPTVDAVEVVRCMDCKKGRPIDKSKCPEKYFKADCVVCECEEVVGDEPMIYEPTHFCSYGERREGE